MDTLPTPPHALRQPFRFYYQVSSSQINGCSNISETFPEPVVVRSIYRLDCGIRT